MKLIFAIVGADDAGAVQVALTKAGHMVTKLSTSGGFLKVGNVTFMIGTSDNKVNEIIDIFSTYCRKRTQAAPNNNFFGSDPISDDYAAQIPVSAGGATDREHAAKRSAAARDPDRGRKGPRPAYAGADSGGRCGLHGADASLRRLPGVPSGRAGNPSRHRGDRAGRRVYQG